ncbi:MAG: hypothetical protein MMC23_007659 [Stictis urceolatum]|nr:hypothetical protein [Stictis urceolata]
MSRSLDSSAGRESPSGSSHYGFGSAMRIDSNSSLAGSQSVPPFDATKAFYNLTDGRGTAVHPEIQAKIDKGFFRADQDWTCYRRNYFAVACAYSFKAEVEVDSEQVFVHRTTSSPERALAFAVCIAAKVDGEDGKPIELVQHTPKRDKGPMSTPDKKELKPNPSGNLSVFSGSGSFAQSQLPSADYDHGLYHGNSENQNVANFERIQFKKATANNGKRRAAQQYFHIVVELFAKVQKGKTEEQEWIKIAHRLSAQMVVRGRSPGHYSDERRGSSTSMGPGSGSGGDLSGFHRDGPSAGMSGSMLGGLAGPSGFPRLGGGYTTHHSSMTHSPPSDSQSIPSSASSIASAPFIDGLQQPASMHMDDSTMSDLYENRFDAQLHTINSRSEALRSTLNSSPPLHESPFAYLSSPPHREEPQFLKAESGRQPRLGPPFSPLFGSDWLSSDSHCPPKDCKPLSLERNRSYFSPMPAL